MGNLGKNQVKSRKNKLINIILKEIPQSMKCTIDFNKYTTKQITGLISKFKQNPGNFIEEIKVKDDKRK